MGVLESILEGILNKFVDEFLALTSIKIQILDSDFPEYNPIASTLLCAIKIL